VADFSIFTTRLQLCTVAMDAFVLMFVDLDKVCRAVSDLERLSNIAKDILECRVESVLEAIGSTQMCILPDDPVGVDEFLRMTENYCVEATQQLSK